MRHLLLLGLAISAGLAGCTSPYRGGGIIGSLGEDARIGKLDIVTFSGNAYTSPELTQRYVLYRSAELAKAGNKPFFLIYSSLTHAAHDAASSSARVGAVYSKPTALSFVRMLDAPALGAYNTEDVLDDLRPVIEQKRLDAR